MIPLWIDPNTHNLLAVHFILEVISEPYPVLGIITSL